MERARFFATLHLGRILKGSGRSKMERWVRLTWFRHGYLFGWVDNI